MSPSYMMRATRRIGLAVLLAFGLATLPAAAMAVSNDDCFGCHSEASMSASDAGLKEGGPAQLKRDLPKSPVITFQVDKDKFAKSVHGGMSCTDCHKDIGSDLPHTQRLQKVDCSGCHAAVNAVFSKSRHVVIHPGNNAANPPRCADCHGAHDILKASDENSHVSAKNVSNTCMRCHGATEAARRSGIPIPGAGKMYSQSVHYKKLMGGDTSAPTCVSCHGSHDLKDRLDPESPIYRTNIAKTCGNCHDTGDWAASTHGVAFMRGAPDAPGCIDCHGDHNIKGKEGKLTVAAIVSEKACPSCHGAEKLAAKYGVEVEKVKGYQDSFHGLSEALGDARVATCADCHTGHKVYPESDVRSSINDNNLKATCGKCHAGVNDLVAQGNIHVGRGGTGDWIKDFVKKLYFVLIIGTIGGMAAHNGLDFFRKMRNRYVARRNAPGYFERLNASERLQHFLTLSTFITLVITGFALKYKWSLPFASDAVNSIGRGLLHRVAAVIMIGASLYHLWYIITTERGRKQFFQMLPAPQDLRDIFDQMQYYLGIKGHGMRAGRFSYIEKMEYLALLWGTIVMIATGFLLWFSTAALQHLPMWALDVATLIHYYEAILATLAIIVWHFYYVFINPDFSPMAFTWLDGKLTREQMEHEHPLELDEVEGRKPGSRSHH
jgi:cytochrome b subunit of formate dehydrogenase/nitrate/TMAO reductase-like tetraheme cytochrome c subunit